MSSKAKNEIYTCAGVLLLILAVGLYLVWVNYGFLPFVVGGFFVAVFAAWAVCSSHKSKHKNPQTTTQPINQPIQQKTLRAFQQATSEEHTKMSKSERFSTRYTDENGNSRWKAPEQFADWAKADKIDVVMKDDAVQIEMEKEGPKIRCSYCGTVYDERLDKCPNCGATRQGDRGTSANAQSTLKSLPT